MNAATLRVIVDDYYRAMGAGDFERVISLHDPDVVCWMSGRSLVSGRFQGRTALYAHMTEHVLGPLVGGEPYVKGSRIVVVDGDVAVGLLHGGLPTKDGSRYDQFYLQIFRFEDGRIREIVEMFDTVMVETQLMKRGLATHRSAPAEPFRLDTPAITSKLTRERMIAVARSFVAAMAGGREDETGNMLTDDAEFRVIGSTPLSGRSTDKGLLGRLFVGGLADSRVVAADAGAAVILARAGARDYAQQYGLLIEADGERIGCVSVFLDTTELEASVFGNVAVPEPSSSIMPAFDIRLALASRSADA